MKIAVMQPYFFPYLGYFQLIAAVDTFVVYDNIKFTKAGWINRNRILSHGREQMITLPVRKAPDHLDVVEREVSPDFDPRKFLNQIEGAYRKAPRFPEVFPLLERIMCFPERNLFAFLHNSILQTCGHLGIGTRIRLSSGIAIDHELRSQAKVLAICDALEATTYVNAIGGMMLYSQEAFRCRGVDLKFIQSRPIEYSQAADTFIPWLSIIDVLMHNPAQRVCEWLVSGYDLIDPRAPGNPEAAPG